VGAGSQQGYPSPKKLWSDEIMKKLVTIAEERDREDGSGA
jgi:hypothetical protein